MISLDATALRALADHLDTLTSSANRTGVLTAADGWDSVSMAGWAHSLQLERTKIASPTEEKPDRTAEVYRLVVGSGL